VGIRVIANGRGFAATNILNNDSIAKAASLASHCKETLNVTRPVKLAPKKMDMASKLENLKRFWRGTH
jgi:predicted Zn-dependent protease